MYYLGIDGGGTKTKYVLCDKQGNKITSVEGPTSHYLQIGLDGVTSELSKNIDDLCKKANINKDQIVSAFVGAPGYGAIESDMDKINAAVKKALGDISFNIGNDGFNALAGAICGDDGINIVAGTGSIGFGYNSKINATLSCGGWLYALGSDEGSGYWFAYELLHEFTRQADGRDEKTPLYYKLREHLNLSSDGEIITIVVEKWKMDRTKVASLASLIDGLYEENDPYVIKIIEKAGKELADIINTLYTKLKFESEIKVSYTGGIFKMGDKILKPLADNLLPGKMKLVSPVLGPEEGSLILALKNGDVAIDDTIINNLQK
ncbi:MAG: BadF/BadG/BcrA/BcrD ATPase family protein [Erysipelotrichaceae bacterium]|nr:BadF/BadG/BcrA/BcrD ATPase family protein [Erysipelotrichaceae bacterium]